MPLVGGPQILPSVPVGVCSSLVRLGNSLCADSCNGEPVPPLEIWLRAGPLAFGPVKGDLAEEELGSPIGDKPDKLMFKEPSAREDDPMVVEISGTTRGDLRA